MCVQQESFKGTKTRTWIGKNIPILVPFSQTLWKDICKSDPHHLAVSFIGSHENVASQSKAKLKKLFVDIETTVNVKLDSILEKLDQRHNRREHARFDMSQDDCDKENCAST